MRKQPWDCHRVALKLVVLLTLLTGRQATAHGNDDKPCSSEFVSAESNRWEKKGYEFHLIKDGAFVQGQYTYLLGAAVKGTFQERESDDLQFLIFRSPLGKDTFALAFAEKIAVFEVAKIPLDREGCVTPAAYPYFRVSVVDLAGNGNQQIIVESNSIGTCSECLSLVEVFQVKGNKIAKVVKEFYNDIKFAGGEGLWIQSFKRDSQGRPTLYEKTFFTKGSNAKSPKAD